VLLYYLGKQETHKLRFFHLNVACCFASKHTKHYKYHQNHHSLSKWSTVCTRQDLGKEYSILQYAALTIDVYQVYDVLVIVSLCQKWQLFFVKPGVKSMDSVAGKLYYLNKCQMLFNVSLMTILSFSKTVYWLVVHSTQSNCRSAKLSTSFLLSYDPIIA